MVCSAILMPKKGTKTRPRFGSRSTAMDIAEYADLTGKIALVTGGNAGIGKETVRALYAAGSTVLLCCRDVATGKRVVEEIYDSEKKDGIGTDTPASYRNPKNAIHVLRLDLSDLAQVEECVVEVKKTCTRLDILVLNAGCICKTLKHTKQGFEEGFGVNFVAHHYLTMRVLDMMTHPGCRIVGVSSTAHWMGKIFIDDLNFEKTKFSGWKSYGQSKLAMLLYMKYLAQKFEKESIDTIKVYAVHPGAIRTNLVDGTRYARLAFALFGFLCKTPEQGAACTMFAATLCEEKNGSYLEDCHLGFMAKHGNDLDMAERLVDATNNELATRMPSAFEKMTMTPMTTMPHDDCHVTSLDQSQGCDNDTDIQRTDIRSCSENDIDTGSRPEDEGHVLTMISKPADMSRKNTFSMEARIS